MIDRPIGHLHDRHFEHVNRMLQFQRARLTETLVQILDQLFEFVFG